MVDVGGQHGATLGYLAAYELGCDVGLDTQLLAVHVLADGHILHLGGYDSALGVCHLCDGGAALGPVGQGYVLEAQMVERMVVTAHAPVFR